MASSLVRQEPLFRRLGARRALTVAVIAALSGACPQAFAATYTVTNTSNSGAGSLRQAILDANASGAYAGVVSGSNTFNVCTYTGGTLATSYQVSTPLTADDFSGPLHITGFAGTVDCTGTLSGTSAQLDTPYLASQDYLGDAFIYELEGAATQNLTTTLSTSGCGFYGYATSFVQPFVLQQMQTQINDIINSYLPSPAFQAPGVGDTICPAP